MKVRWFLSAAAIVLMLGLAACGGSPEPIEAPDPMEPGVGIDEFETDAPELTPPPMPEPGELPAPQDPGAPEVEIEPVQPEGGAY